MVIGENHEVKILALNSDLQVEQLWPFTFS